MHRNTGRPNRNLDVMVKFTKRHKTPGITLKNMALSEGNQLFASVSHALRDEINAGMLQFTKKWN